MTDLSSRYGTRTRPRWFWPTVAALGITIGIAFAAWVGFQDKPVTGRLWGYEVKNEHLVVAKLDVIRPDSLAARCTVYAQAKDHSIVGEKTVEIKASQAERVRVTIDIETERKAVTAVLRTCLPQD